MIELNVDRMKTQDEYFVEFRHVTKLGKRRELYDRYPVKAVTTCVIVVKTTPWTGAEQDEGEIRFIAIGNAICANDDNFSRREGRLKAFDKALRHCGAFSGRNGLKAALIEAYLQIDSDPPVREHKPLSPEEIDRRRVWGSAIYVERQARHRSKD